MPKNFDINWRNTIAVLLGLAGAVIIFLFSFVLPAYFEYTARNETKLEGMYATYMIYTVISVALFAVAWLKNLWSSQKSTFARDVGATAIGFNCLLWGFMFIMSLPK